MTPTQWILIVWSLGTCIATVMMILHAEDDDTYKKLNSDYGSIYAPRFIMFLFYVAAFVHSLLFWWQTIPRMIFAWIKLQVVMWVIRKILAAAESGNSAKMARMKKVLDMIRSKDDDGPEEEKKDVV